jgi:LAO/AO transport system kinase
MFFSSLFCVIFLPAFHLLYFVVPAGGARMELAEKIIKGDVQAAARLITLIEDENPAAFKEMDSLYPDTGQAYIIGVTGAPGVGKSTLTDSLIGYFRQQQMSVGVIAIDPTSALTGGALLGDRIRMQRHSADEQVFIRSLATRGWTGGLAKAALAIAHVMDAMGKDIILMETVGSGQIESDIVKAADTTLLVMAPGAGDEIQAMKAGILEEAAIIAVNKADKEGAGRLKADLEMVLETGNREPGLRPPVFLTEALNDKGTGELGGMLIKYREAILSNTGAARAARRHRVKLELIETVEGHFREILQKFEHGDYLEKVLDSIQDGQTTPGSAAREIVNRILKEKEG